MDLITWLRARRSIGHRKDAADDGHTPRRVRAAIRSGAVRRLSAQWIGLADAPADLAAAASASARLTCVSLARHRGWWIPEGTDAGLHLQVAPNGHRPAAAVAHWSTPIVDRGPRTPTASMEDALSHIASCLAREAALTIWESAIQIERLDLEYLRGIRWPTPAARKLASRVTGASDSGIETVFVVRLSTWGVPLRQQVRLAGRRVDVVIGSHLVVQIDGFAHRSSAADRGRDVAHDAELRLRGYTVLRFTYAQIVHGWDEVERIVASALARGLHLPLEAR